LKVLRNVAMHRSPAPSPRAMPDERAKPPAERYTLEDLLSIMVRLRDPETGCPWDVQQSYASIAPYTIEEAYEVADAIAREDLDALKEELGDLLLQVVYHAQMASEDERFGFADVVDGIQER
jgi:nucleoside triphosphate diphosphatase